MTGKLRPLGSLLPLPLLRQLHGDDGRRPAEITLSGAALIVDVSRYTALVEDLSHRGPAGLEKIATLLSQSYTRCVELVALGGGEVIRFTGDSILVFWSDDIGGAQHAVLQASRCADAICMVEPQTTNLSETQVQPAFHAGIGHGSLSVAAVGGDPNWKVLVGGDAFQQAAHALARAGTYDVELSPAARERIDSKGVSARHHPDRPADTLVTHPPEQWLRGFLPSRTIRLLATAGSDFQLGSAVGLGMESEVRPMSVMFGRFAETAHSSGQSVLRLHDLCRHVQSTLRDHDGPIGEFFLDGSGLVCLAAFGESGAFHRDDPKRALDTAQEIVAKASDWGIKAAIGVATGDSVYQLVGSPDRFEPILLGQPVNRAARLMDRAEGNVLCDSQTQRLAREQFEFSKSETLQLAGFGEVVPAFQPQAMRSASPFKTKMIGRDRELATLEGAYKDVRTGAKRIVAVLGEPGIGKTTLVNAFSAAVEASGGSITTARAERDDRRTSLLVWRQVLHAITGLTGSSDEQAVYDAIRVRLQDHSKIAAGLPLLGDVLAIELEDTEGTVHLTGAHRADATMRLTADVIGALTSEPFAVILEDSQWLDSASWRLTEWIMTSLPSILVVLCVRVGEIPDQLRALQSRAAALEPHTPSDDSELADHFRQIQLRKLDENSVRQLITLTLDGAPAKDEIEQRIMELAGGNPLFAEEVALSLKSEGLISLRDGRWQSIRPIEDLVYFEGVEKVIRERIDKLDPKARNVLTAASVVGRSFDMRPLEHLLEFSATTIVQELVDAQLVSIKSVGAGYQFRHDQIRDVVYSSMPSQKRQKLHASLAAWLETEYAKDASGEISALVQHFEAAGANDQATKYADIAATNALRNGAYREVESFLSICLENESPSHRWTQEEKFRSVRWRRQLAEAHYGRGDIRAQGDAIRAALDAAGEKVPEGKLPTLAKLASRGAQLLARQAFPASQDFPGDSAAARWDAEIARCLNQTAIVDYFQLRFARGMCSLLGAVIRSEKTGISAETVMSNCQLGAGLGMMGWNSMNARLMGRARQVADRLQDPSLLAHVNTLDSLWRLGFCDWDMVDQRLDQAQQLALKSGDQLRWCNAQGIRFWSQYYRGDLGALEETSALLLRRAQNAGNIQQEIWALRCKALCLLHIERPREAIGVLRLTTSGMKGSVDLAAQISAQGALALALNRTGKNSESYEAAVATLQLLEQMRRPSSHSVIVGISSVLEVLLRGRAEGLAEGSAKWRDLEDSALSKLEHYSKVFPVGRAQLGMWRGKRHWLDARQDAAMSEWNKGLDWARRHNLRKDAALIEAEIRRWKL